MINNIGKKFKELRTAQNISLAQATRSIKDLSISRLSHWEKSDGEIPLHKLDQLLYNIHILPSEFENWIDIRPANSLINKLQIAFINDDVNTILSLSKNQLKRYNNTNKKEDLFLAGAAYNLYFQLTNKNIFPEIYRQKITMIFSKNTFWTQYYISIFSNTVDLIDPDSTYRITISLIKDFSIVRKLGLETKIFAITAILNSLNALIIRKPKLAQKLMGKINKLPKSLFNNDSSIRKKFLFHILNFRITNNPQDLEIANNLIGVAEYIDRSDIAKELKLTLSQVRNS